MNLSIVIVNYNVNYFLRQCLDAVFKASQNMNVEVFVVDNNSQDGSVKMVKENYKEVILIENKENTGFSKANNQAIERSKGKYVLLLNPDTIVAEDTFDKVVDFMDQHPKAGGLGIKMIDGNGVFLPESKRGLPTPTVAFYKIFGFSKFFPKSKKFGKYHLGFLPVDETNKVDVLSGAFMLLRKETLVKTGLLDETFFMYGEDIDLSYRITLAGYDNYYFADSFIVHYKGESTKKSSVNYVFIFYKAMVIFAQKHFGKTKANSFNFFIKLAIFFRAGLALFNRFIKIILLPLIDALSLFAGLHLAKRIFQHEQAVYHSPLVINTAIGILITITLTALYYNGGYDKPIQLKKIILGLLMALPLNAVVYYTYQNYFLFTPAIGFTAIFLAAFLIILVRIMLHLFKIIKIKSTLFTKNILIIGEKTQADKTQILIELTQPEAKIIKYIIAKNKLEEKNTTTLFNELTHKLYTEIIFCNDSLSYKKMIEFMSAGKYKNIEFKIAHPTHNFIIGSTNLNTSGELYTLKLKGISNPHNIRIKRLIDFFGGLFLFLFSPFLIWFMGDKSHFFKNITAVFIGKKTFVGYVNTNNVNSLPQIKKGILSYKDGFKSYINKQKVNYSKLNNIYAKDYSILVDLKIIYRGFKLLDKN